MIIKIQKIKGGGYFSPEVERVDVQIEKGFALSGLGEDDTVDM